MKYTKLGNSDLNVSKIAFGCMSLEIENTKNSILLRKAVNSGINLFDTADLYNQGENERIVGKALKPMRKDIFIATKVGNRWREDGSGWDWVPTKAHIISAVDDSLSRLQTDYIDLYQLHGGTIDDNFDEVFEAFELLKSKGKIRFFGISSIRPNVIRKTATYKNITSVMMQYSLLDRRPEAFCLDFLHSNNIGVIVRGALAKGLLINKPAQSYLEYSSSEVQYLQTFIKEISNKDSGQVALQFVLKNPTVSTVAVGIRTEEQLTNVLESVKNVSISDIEMQKISSILKPKTYQNHL